MANNKLREACANIAEYARSAMCHTTDTHVLGYLNQIEGWAKAALAEPPRNCDVGMASEQEDRFAKYCRGSNYCAVCPIRKSWDFKNGRRPSCAILWAQMPYEEGGAK